MKIYKGKIHLLTLSSLLIINNSFAGTIKTLMSDLELSGGLSTSYVRVNNTPNGAEDTLYISSLNVEILNKLNDKIGFVVSIGSTNQWSILDKTFSDKNPINNFGIEYGYISIRPLDNIIIDIGKLLTNVGVESYHTYDNQHTLFGMIWTGQPVSYNGVRITYEVLSNLNAYFEINKDNTAGEADKIFKPKGAIGFGFNGTAGKLKFAVNYYDYNALKNIWDLYFEYPLWIFDIGLNIDYQWLDNTAVKEIENATGQGNIDNFTIGTALYINTHINDKIEVPIRVEYINDSVNGSIKINNEEFQGLYPLEGNDAYSITVSPTYKPNKNSFARLGISYIEVNRKVEMFSDKNLAKPDNSSRLIVSVEAGFQF